MSITLQNSRPSLGSIASSIWCGALMALPLTGLVLFFEMTQPAKVANAGFVATQIESNQPEVMGESGARPWPLRGQASIARFEGVSAERTPDKAAAPVAQALTARDAAHILARAPFGSLTPGSSIEVVSKDRRRISLLVVSREPITDRPMPDNARLANITEASTTNVMTFAWGHWIYKVEIEDKGVEPDVVVQKVL